MTLDDLCHALQFAAALLQDAPEFPHAAQDAAAIDALACAINDRRVIIPPDVLDDCRAAWERASTAEPMDRAKVAAKLLGALGVTLDLPVTTKRPR